MNSTTLATLPAELGSLHALHRPCPTCGATHGAHLGQLTYALFDRSPLADRYQVVACGDCGVVFCDTPSSQQDYDRFYEEYYYSPAYLAHRILPEEEEYFRETIATIRPFLEKGRPALFDIGSGTGNLLKAGRACGLTELYAIDPSASCVELLRQAGFHAGLGSVSQIPFPEVRPGVLVLSHVVEHIVAMTEAIESVRRRVAEGGVVYVEVPDAARYEQYHANAPLRFFYLQHVIHFDERHLDNLFAAHGLRKVQGGRRVRVENELTMPALWGIYAADPAGRQSPLPDFDLARQVKRWFDQPALDPQGVFDELADQARRVYLWGIGIHVQMMLGMSPLSRCNIVCCVDQDPKLQRRTIQGRPIVSPDVLRQATPDDTVVIGSLIHRQKMLAHLRQEIGFQGQVVGL